MDNFDDFTPSSKSASTLASIFGKTSNQSSDSNPSLMYTPTRQPKKEVSPHTSSTAEGTAKLELIVFKSVHAFKLVNGSYEAMGKMGLALVGCQSPPVFQLLLYRTKENILSKSRLKRDSSFEILDNNYASFYADDQINFSVMFESSVDVEFFAEQYAIAKSALGLETIVQDLMFSDGKVVPEDGEFLVSVKPFRLLLRDVEPLGDEEEIRVDFRKPSSWLTGLRGMKFGASRVVILSCEYSKSPWDHLLTDGKLLLIVRATKQPETPQFSSADESPSLKEKGAIIEGVIAGKSHKSGLLSRVAQLGQPTLPLKGAITADFTDSEEEPPKLRTRPSLPPRSVPKVAEPVAIYQPPFVGSNFGALVPVAPTGFISPGDGGLSAHFAESRTQATELRMNLAKIADKVDFIYNKFQSQTVAQPPPPVTDAAGVLAGVQSLVLENQSLREKSEVDKVKYETQSEVIYQMSKRCKSLERATSGLNKESEEGSKKEVESLKNELRKIENEAEQSERELEATKLLLKRIQGLNEELSEKIKQTENRLEIAESQKVTELEEKCSSLAVELERLKKELSQKENLEMQVSRLEKEKNELEKRGEERTDVSDTKILMNLVYKNLYSEFNADGQYSGTAIKQVVGSVIKRLTLEFLEGSEKKSPEEEVDSERTKTPSNSEETIPSLASPVAAVRRSGAQNISESASPSGSLKTDEENQIMYDQVWRSNEPPPPLPTFDDDEENVW